MDGSSGTYPENADVVVIGAGIAGLAATLRLATLGVDVILIEAHDHLGGKIRNIPSAAGPVAAGPTVLTLRHVFDDLFELAGVALDDELDLTRQEIIARHFWSDGSRLDLYHDIDRSREAIRAFSGAASADEFVRFCDRTKRLFEAFEDPVMLSPAPNLAGLVSHVLKQPSLIPVMSPFSSLKGMLLNSFSDPRLRQLFGRYATYVGGAPAHAPAVLSLIWHAEASGVYTLDGGIAALAKAIGRLAAQRGARIRTGTKVQGIFDAPDGVKTIRLDGHNAIDCNAVIHAGDPRALATGLLGEKMSSVAQRTREMPRSFSARVHSFAAKFTGPDLAHHNVFFDADPDAEFDALMQNRLPERPSFYVCAMDRGQGHAPDGLERFEIITNAPALPNKLEDPQTWHPKIIRKMARFGISFHPSPTASDVTTETHFERMFPGSAGALYGQSPHGLTASLKRPTAKSGIPGLYLAGGGCHPGAGVPMAALSGKHAVEAILNDRILASPSRPMAMHGGT